MTDKVQTRGEETLNGTVGVELAWKGDLESMRRPPVIQDDRAALLPARQGPWTPWAVEQEAVSPTQIWVVNFSP